MGAMRPKTQYQLPLAFMTEGRGESPDAGREGTESPTAKREPENPATFESLMEEVCERENLEQAWHRVRSNQGSAGVDGRTIDETRDYLREHWPTIREQLLNGTYEPLPVRSEAAGFRILERAGKRWLRLRDAGAIVRAIDPVDPRWDRRAAT